MHRTARVGLLAGLLLTSVALSGVLLWQTSLEADGPRDRHRDRRWFANDAPAAVATLMQAGRFTPMDRASLPGMIEATDTNLSFKAKGAFAGKKVNLVDEKGRLTPVAKAKAGNRISSGEGTLADTKKKTGSAWPFVKWTPKKSKAGDPGVSLKGKKGTEVKKLKRTDDLKTGRLLVTKAPSQVQKFKFKKEVGGRTAKFAPTKVELGKFKKEIQTAKKRGNGEAKKKVTGSVANESAKFRVQVKVRDGAAAKMKVTKNP